MRFYALLLAVLIAGISGERARSNWSKSGQQALTDPLPTSTRLALYSQNPRYWQYRDKPVLLLGGSIQDNLFQVPDVEAQLDRLSSVGGNYVRNTMSSRDKGNVWEFKKNENGKYNLTRFNEVYFRRFEKLLKLAFERDIIVQIELWDRFDFAREPWLSNPYRPANNINYSPEETGLKNRYPEHPGSNNSPFFRSVPARNNNRILLEFQQKRVDQIMAVSLRYPNVLYVMDNETSANPDWGSYWARYIRQKARNNGVEIWTTEMWDAWDLKDEEHRRTLDHPELYGFADISQNNHNTGQEHWTNLQWVRSYVAENPRPLNNVKIYGSNRGRYGTQRDALERFWRNIIGGSASARFHRPASGIGLSETAQTNLKSARQLEARFDIFHARPDNSSELLGNRNPDEAYLSYIAGEEYAVYFTDGGEVKLDLNSFNREYKLSWLQIDRNRWSDAGTVTGGQWITLTPPGDGQWIALTRKAAD